MKKENIQNVLKNLNNKIREIKAKKALILMKSSSDEERIREKKQKEWTQKRKELEKELEKRRREKQRHEKGLFGRKHKTFTHLSKAGLSIDHKLLSKRLFDLCVFINFMISMWAIYFFSTHEGYRWSTIFLSVSIIWIFLFFFLLFLLWLLFYLTLDVRIFKRKKSIEEVLPDFLELTAANINAGMTIDKALWYSVRPKFGVLAKEVETVAKQTMSGMDLPDALRAFSQKYDSETLKRSVNLLIEGIDAGGEIGDLLHKIASNIKESQLLRKEMSASVANYAIFITFAAIIAAPLLMGLATQLLAIISQITSSIDIPANVNVPLKISEVGIKMPDFRIFAFINLGLTALFSSAIVSIIKKGEIKEGMKMMPTYLIISFMIYYIITKAIGALVGSMF